MKILCPTDFSSAASNGIEFAARLCQRMNGTLTLLNVQHLYISEGVSLFSGGERESVSEAKVSAKALDEICLDINKIFKISCSHEIVSSISSIENIIANETGKYNLTVMGTNGADTIYQYYFGSHGFRVANSTSNPVIIVPENCPYKDISNIVFASDYNKGDDLLLIQLKEFTEALNAKLNVLHVSENDSALSHEVYRSFCNITEETLNYSERITFKRIINKKEIEAIENYMNESKADILAVCMKKHGILYRLTHENLVKKLTSFSDYPILVLHK